MASTTLKLQGSQLKNSLKLGLERENLSDLQLKISKTWYKWLVTWLTKFVERIQHTNNFCRSTQSWIGPAYARHVQAIPKYCVHQLQPRNITQRSFGDHTNSPNLTICRFWPIPLHWSLRVWSLPHQETLTNRIKYFSILQFQNSIPK